MSIPIYSKYGSVSEAVARPTDAAHGLSTSQIEDMNTRLSSFMPSISKTAGSSSRLQDMFQGDLPKGASWDPRKAQIYPGSQSNGGGGGGGRQLTTLQQPYQPEFASPDRQQYPVHRILANRYWRLFYKLDPVIGNCVDLYGDLPWSNFELTGEGVEGEIRQQYEYMCRETQVLAILPQIVKEFLVVGEAIPHTFFDEEKGVFTHVALHNPDQMEVIDAPFIKMEPVLEFIPDDRLRSILTSDQPSLRKIREKMPTELINRLNARQNIPLSSLNATFIPRKLHPYDTRGTSMISRMWRVLMLEDAVFNATIQIARRHACFVAGTSVIMADGIKNIEDIKIGDKVISGTGSIETVEAAWEEPPSETIVIEAAGTERIECTPNHNFLIFKSQRDCACGCGGQVGWNGSGYHSAFINSHNSKRSIKTGQIEQVKCDWKIYSENPKVRTLASYNPIQKAPASEIKPGDYMLIPRKFDEIKPDCTLEQARLLGYYVAEGNLKSVNKHKIGGATLSFGESVCPNEQKYVADVVNICATLNVAAIPSIRYTPSMIKSGRQACLGIDINQINSIWLVDWLAQHGGCGASTKQFSEEVMRWPLEYKMELLKGLYRGDGSRSKCSKGNSHQVAMGLTSKALIYQTRLILAQLGILGSISANPRKAQHPDWNDCWIISSTGADARYLSKSIFDEDIESPWGKESRKGMKTWVDENYIYTLVQEVYKRPDAQLVSVFNLTISGDHSYTANGVQCFNSPLKVAKLGNAQTGWIPPPEQEKRLLELLAQAELDPNAWLVYHYGIAFETVGTTDKVMSVNREWDIIERIKLVAMGISKSFLHGEVSYASSATGLQVFLQRLKSMRMFFEQKWLYPKFFRPIAEINGWIKPKPSEVNHRYRVKRSARELEEQNAYIVPKIVWDKSLDPQVNSELIAAMTSLEGLGVKFSKTTKMAAVGYSFEEETKKTQREIEFEKQFLPALPGAAPAEGGGGPMGGGGGGMPPGEEGADADEGDAQTPPGLDGAPPPGVNAPPAAPAPGGAALELGADEGKSVTDSDKPKPSKSSHDNLKSEIWNDDQFGNWKADEVSELISLIETGETESAFWHQLSLDVAFLDAASIANPEAMWAAMDQYLIEQGYPEKDIRELQYILEKEGQLLAPEQREMMEGIENDMPEDAGQMSDSQFASMVAKVIKKNSGKITADNGNFLSGFDVPDTAKLMGDISDLMPQTKKKSKKKTKK